MDEDQEDQPQQEKPDPNVYQPDQEDDDIEIDRRIRRANERLKRMTMVGFPQINETFGCQDTLTVEGGFETGWAINYIDCGQALAGGSEGDDTGACCLNGNCSITTAGNCVAESGEFQGSGTTCTPNPCLGATTGACCIDGECSILSESDCTDGGGTYQGDDTTCDDVDCVQGACCTNETSSDCHLTTESDCTGTYFGDGSTCDPNPCPSPPCCGFSACDGSGRIFQTKVTTVHIVKGQSCLNSDPTLTCENGIDGTRVTTESYNPITCAVTSSTVRSGDWSLIGGFETLTFHRCNGTTGHTDPISCGTSCISATEEYCSSETDFDHSPLCTPGMTSLIVTIDVVYSDECTSGGGAFGSPFFQNN